MGEGLSNELLNLALLLTRARLLNTGLDVGEQSPRCDEPQLETYRRLIDLVSANGEDPRSVLEVGAGFGVGAGYIGDRLNVTPVAVDVSIVAGLAARSRRELRSRANLRELPFRDGSFDLVCAVECLVCTDDPELSYAECRRVLQSGGRLAIAEFRLGDISAARRYLSAIASKTGFRIVAFEDLTKDARSSVLSHANRRAETIRVAPALTAKWIREIAALPGSKRYEQWRNRERCYFSAILEKS